MAIIVTQIFFMHDNPGGVDNRESQALILLLKP